MRKWKQIWLVLGISVFLISGCGGGGGGGTTPPPPSDDTDSGTVLNIGAQFEILGNLAPASTDKPEQPGRPAMASDGTNFLVVSAITNATGASTLVGLFLDNNGNELGSPFLIDFLEDDAESSRPALAFINNHYLLVYQDGRNIFGRIIDTNGALKGFIPLTTDNNNALPALAIDKSRNRALIVWVNKQASDPIREIDFFHLYGTLVELNNPDIFQPVNPPFPILGTQPENIDNNEPTVAYDGANYLVLWRHFDSETEKIEVASDIYGIMIEPFTGTTSSGKFPVSTAALAQGAPQLAFDGTNYLAVWSDLRNGAPDIYATRIDKNRNVLDASGIPVNTADITYKGFPNLSYNGTDYLVAWANGDTNNPADSGIFGNRVTTGGQLVDATASQLGVAISDEPPHEMRYIYPIVATNSVGDSLAAWVDNAFEAGTSKSLLGAIITTK